MSGFHKSLKGLKREAFFLLSLEGLCMGVVIVKGSRWIISSADPFAEVTCMIFFSLFINILWLGDSKYCITNAFFRRCLWGYVVLEAILMLSMYLSALAGWFALSGVLAYVVVAYLILGIVLNAHFL